MFCHHALPPFREAVANDGMLFGVFAVTIFGRDKIIYAPDGLSGGSNAPAKYGRKIRKPSLAAPGALTVDAGALGVLLHSKFRKAQAKAYFDVYGRRSSEASHVAVHAVADLQNRFHRHPTCAETHKEVEELLSIEAPSAIRAVDAALAYDMMALYEGDGNILHLLPPHQEKLYAVDKLLAQLFQEYHQEMAALKRH